MYLSRLVGVQTDSLASVLDSQVFSLLTMKLFVTEAAIDLRPKTFAG